MYCCAGVFYCRKDPIEKSSSDFHEMRGIMTGCPFPSHREGRRDPKSGGEREREGIGEEEKKLGGKYQEGGKKEKE